MRPIFTRMVALGLVAMALGWRAGGPAGASETETAPAKPEEPTIELPPAATVEVDFSRDIQPILKENCFKCHGRRKAKGGFRLSNRENLMAGGDEGMVIAPGDSAASRLILYVAGADETVMPPEGDRLTAEQIGLLRAWIDQGAPWSEEKETANETEDQSGHWAFRPVRRPPEPEVHNAAWVRNPIDAFILHRLESEGIEPSPEADRTTQIRRLYLDLLGLPPAPDEVDAFLDDPRPYAYERLVTQVLASPHFGERWGRHWLDLARFAESDGFEKDLVRPHAWRYREWVIDAINRDMPYDQFVIEQLAGDLLPNPTTEQLVATGFHRNTLTNREGGVDPEQFRIEQVVDRTDTTGLVFLGLTVGCARCHSHKYDPITQREYYQLLAFFNTEVEKDIPAPLEAQTQAYRGAHRSWERDHAKFVEAVNGHRQELAGKLEAWEKQLDFHPIQWTVLDPAGLSSAGGAGFSRLDDGSLLLTGNGPEKDNYTFVANTQLQGITAIGLEVLTDSSLPENGPGRASNGNFVLSEFKIKASPLNDPTAAQALTIATADADYSQPDYPIAQAIDDRRDTGWAVGGPDGPHHGHRALFTLAEDAGFEGGTTLAFTLEQHYGSAHTIGRLRISLTTADRQDLIRLRPYTVQTILATAPEQRSDEQKDALLDYFADQDPRMRELEAALEGHRKAEPKPADVKAQTLAKNPEPPETHIMIRGDFLNPGDRVQADTLDALQPFHPRGDRPDRLDLAHWIVDPANPLTARVEVNRLWEHLFGGGLVETSEDFGTRGDPPSHPALLDWLSDEFVRKGWSRKAMIRLIVTSATYRQASLVRTELAERDPTNRLLAGQRRFRVEAEITRDLFLAASGLLNPRIGGPSIRPPLPGDIAELGYADSVKWRPSEGDDQYRRGLYIFFQRTVPYPMLMTFDCPDSNTAKVRRNRSNTPLQALTLLNDPVFVQCAQALGRRVIADGPQDERERIRYAVRLCLARDPSEVELTLLTGLLADQRRAFTDDPQGAETLVSSYRPETVEAPEAAAWVAVGRMIMNLDEFLTRE